MLQLFGIGGLEWIIIAIIIVAIFFGARKIPEIARSFGRVSAEFQKARLEAKREIELTKNQGIIQIDKNLKKLPAPWE